MHTNFKYFGFLRPASCYCHIIKKVIQACCTANILLANVADNARHTLIHCLYIVYTLHVVRVLPALIAGITRYISVHYLLLLACLERVIHSNYLHFTRTLPHHICSVTSVASSFIFIILKNCTINFTLLYMYWFKQKKYRLSLFMYVPLGSSKCAKRSSKEQTM